MKPWYLRTLSVQEALSRANKQLEKARNADNQGVALKHCDKVETALSRIELSAVKKNQSDLEKIILAFNEHGQVLETWNEDEKALKSYNEAKKLKDEAIPSTPAHTLASAATLSPTSPQSKIVLSRDGSPGSPLSSTSSNILSQTSELILASIFAKDRDPYAYNGRLPKPDKRLDSTCQLAYCLGLLQISAELDDTLDTESRTWLQATRENKVEQERLMTVANEVLREFLSDKPKDAKAVAEVVCLAPVLERDDFRLLLDQFVNNLSSSILLNTLVLEGLDQVIQSAPKDSLSDGDLVEILKYLNLCLEDIHSDSLDEISLLTRVVSHVLDAMALGGVQNLNRVNLHTPLKVYLQKLIKSDYPYLRFQAAYASQALLWVPNDEEPWKAVLRRAGIMTMGVARLVSAAKALNVAEFIEGLGHIQEGLEGADQFFGPVTHALKAITEVIKPGQGLQSFFKDFNFSCKQKWYPVLRAADTLLRNGELIKFKSLVCDSPCRHDVAFQWGVCQRLGDIAADLHWDTDTRQGAITFLGEIYRNEGGKKVQVQQCVLNILMQLASVSGFARQPAELLLQDLRNDGDATKQAYYQAYLTKGPSPHPWQVVLPLPTSSPLLDCVQNKPSVGAALRNFQSLRLQERGRQNAVYIPPQAKANLEAPDDELFDLADKVKEFLASDQKVLLLLGDSGAGKSTFNLELERTLWDAYDKYKKRIPVFITLPTIDRPDENLIAKNLCRYDFNEEQIRELKSHHEFILICDGYDECQQQDNLYTSNRLNQPGEWKAQMVITCRSEYIGYDYRRRLQPGDRNDWTGGALLQEAVIAPFSQGQIRHYIDKYVAKNAPNWKVEDYLQALDRIPGLQDLVKNPFLLTLSLWVLPSMVDFGENMSSFRVTRVALYDEFVKQWVDRGMVRLQGKKLWGNDAAVFNRFCNEGFLDHAISFMKDLAVAIFEKQGGAPVVKYLPTRDKIKWQHIFFSQDDGKHLLLEACPIVRIGNTHQYRFIHRSVLEYGLARAIFDPQSGAEQEALGANGSAPDFTSPLCRTNFVKEYFILQFLAERVQQEPLFESELLAFIEQSKADKKWSLAAANAITILLRAKMRFNEADLKGIQIPGADLSGGHFDSAQLQGADLSNATLRNIWLRQANLSNAQMKGVEFGERPYLMEDGPVYSCAYSPDGTACVFSIGDGKIVVYDASTWTKSYTLQGHRGSVNRVAYSPCGQQIVSGSSDMTVQVRDVKTSAIAFILRGHINWVQDVVFSPCGHQIATGSLDTTVRLWDVETGAPGPILIGHDDRIWSVAYSPSGQQIASGSGDKTVRLWDVQTGAPRLILYGHTKEVTSVAYSPCCQQIASGSSDTTVRLWDMETGAPGPILNGHSAEVWSIAYSPSGQQIASSSSDKTVRLWDVQSATLNIVLSGHTAEVRSAVYSPCGKQIASGSGDTVRLWDAETGAPGHILSGHAEQVWSVAYSPCGQHIASGGHDKTVRLWDVQSVAFSTILSGHTAEVWSVACSPSGQQIASGGRDKTVRLWDTQTGTPGLILSGHTSAIWSVVYSPSSQKIASGSLDTTVRLWDLQSGASVLILSGHADAVESVVYSPCGQQIASGSRDKTVRLWDAQTGAPGHILSGYTSWVHSVAYSPCGRQIASGSSDSTVRLWDVQTGASGHILTSHLRRVRSVVYSPCGKQIASGNGDSVWLWDAQTGASGLILSGHGSEGVNCVAYSPCGQQIVSGGSDKMVRLWDAKIGSAPDPILNGHTNTVNCVVYQSCGQQIASGSGDRTVRLWDAKTGLPIHILKGHTDIVNCVVYPLSGQQIASGSRDKTVRLWDAKTGSPIHILKGHTNTVNCVAYPPCGQQIASGSRDRTVRLWDAKTGSPGHILKGHTDTVNCVVYPLCGQQIASGSDDATVRLWDAQTGSPGRILGGLSFPVYSVAYSPCGQWIVVAGENDTMRLWEAQTGASGPILSGHDSWVTSVAYSPSGQQIASGSRDETVRLWDAQTGAPGHILRGHDSWVTSVAYSPCGQQIASGGDDNVVRLWDSESGAPGLILRGHIALVTSVAYSPSGQQIASGSNDNTVRLWDTETGAPGHILSGHDSWVTSVAYSPSGQQIASGGSDNTVWLWDAKTGASGLILRGHTSRVTSIAYSPSGRQIASGSSDCTVRLWNAETGASGSILEGHTKQVWSVVYSPSGQWTASGSSDKTVRLWNAETGAFGPILGGHTSRVTSVAYSPSGRQIASGSSDSTVRLWNAQTGALSLILSGHTGWVGCLVYSPWGQQIASGSSDKTVRLWDVNLGRCLTVLDNFQGLIASISWSAAPNGIYFATSCDDRSVCMWQVMEEEGHFYVRLQWASMHNRLIVWNTSLQGVQGLSRINVELLEQRGAVSESIL